MNSTADLVGPELPELAASGLFDSEWYLAVNPDVQSASLDALQHWLRFGCQEARNPNRYFDVSWYLARNPDVKATGLNPLLHYLRHGEREGRKPVSYFDPLWYRAAYEIPPNDLALRHFLTFRFSGRYAPCPELYGLFRVQTSHEQPKAGERLVSDIDLVLQRGTEIFPDEAIVEKSGLLDSNYYLINGSDVHEAALGASTHFCRFGWKEGRKPNIYFDTTWYLQSNPDVSRLRINPLVHYVIEGESAGRRPVVYFDPIWYRSRYEIEPGVNALAHYLTHRRTQKYSPNPLFDVGWYARQAGARIGRNRDPFAHYLEFGTFENISPSPRFDAGAYRRNHLGRPSRAFRRLMNPEQHNPLVHHLLSTYR